MGRYWQDKTSEAFCNAQSSGPLFPGLGAAKLSLEKRARD
jgi:hypothetical protein